MKNEKKSRYKWPIKRKIVAIICVVYIVCFSSFLFLFYGPFTAFKEFWITSAMTTKSHQYLATFIYSDKSYYSGKIKNGIFSGEGSMKWNNGTEYHGNFTDSILSAVSFL